MAFYFSSVTKALYDTDVFPVASLPANKVEITQAVYTDLMTKQNQGYVILADGSGNPYTVNQSEATATDIKHAASVATTLALGHVKIGNTMTAANDGTIDVKDSAVGTSKLSDDSVTADKVKDNETLPVNISGHSRHSYISISNSIGSTGQFYKVGTMSSSEGADRQSSFIVSSTDDIGDNIPSVYLVTVCNRFSAKKVRYMRLSGAKNPTARLTRIGYIPHDDNSIDIVIYRPAYSGGLRIQLLSSNSFSININENIDGTGFIDGIRFDIVSTTQGQVGSATTPVYVDPNGQVQPCNVSPFIIDKIVNEDGTDIRFFKTVSLNDSSTWVTIGKLNITPSNKNCIVDFTFIISEYSSNDSQNLPTDLEVNFGVFVGNTQVEFYQLKPSTYDYKSSTSFRCTFSANINNNIYIKVCRAYASEPHSVTLDNPKVKGLAFYTD